VTHVTDGDTVWVRVDREKPVPVRLHGIDAPERCQTGGPEATEALARRVLRERVDVDTLATDQYGRTVGVVTLDGDDLGEWLVRGGHAWSVGMHYGKGPYADAQRSAQRAHRGLFSAADPQPPWVFRKANGACPREPRKTRKDR